MPALAINDERLVIPKGKKPGWTHTKSGMDGGKYGQVVHVAMVNEHGEFLFDKPVIEEGPHVITLPYGVDPKDGQLKLGLIKEQRDTAAVLNGEDSPMFWGPPRGYAEQTDEGLIAAARREAGEEAGIHILAATPWIVATDTVPNETIVRSRSPWVALPVDLEQLGEAKNDRHEKIFKTEFFSEKELGEIISFGSYDGASASSWCLMSAFTMFLLHVKPAAKARQP